jgi:glycosyltransferase involved in cell wall biosynthesis
VTVLESPVTGDRGDRAGQDGIEERALAARLRSAAPFLLRCELPPADPDPAADAACLVQLMVAELQSTLTNDRVWLLLTAITGAYPARADVDRVRRAVQLLDEVPLTVWLLDTALGIAAAHGATGSGMDVVTGAVVVDVDHTAKHDLHTGIQRVTRSLMPLWSDQRAVVPAAWTEQNGALRSLSAAELDRVVRFPSRRTSSVGARGGLPGADERVPPRLIVPWRSVVMMAEVPPGDVSGRVAAMGQYSGNRLVGIAYDAIPVVSADMVPPVESSKFVRYLTSVKFASRMAGISAAAAAEIAGFVEALGTQGLPGPTVREVALPSPSHGGDARGKGRGTTPSVLAVGSHEPRKNHLAVLHAAEVLWREGLQFSVTFIGGSGWGDDFPRRAEHLRSLGRPLSVRRAVSEQELDRAYSSALFTVFPSLHEGYGLPVAESLAHGTPVITSNFGSTAEIGLGGGAVLVDPRDDAALIDAMRLLLTDQRTVERLRSEIAGRRVRTWQDYADELWDQLVAPELRELTGEGVDDDEISA